MCNFCTNKCVYITALATLVSNSRNQFCKDKCSCVATRVEKWRINLQRIEKNAINCVEFQNNSDPITLSVKHKFKIRVEWYIYIYILRFYEYFVQSHFEILLEDIALTAWFNFVATFVKMYCLREI